MNSSSLRLPAPAKLNLMLRIVGRRPDGYHLLQSVFQFLDICDWITLDLRGDGVVNLSNPLPGVPEDADLTVRAAKALQQCCGRADLGVTITIEKILPMGGGLGGGSSDAATMLLGLNSLWGLGLSIDTLAELGLKLGADVPVFVRGHAAWAEGVGELLTRIDDLPEPWYIVAVPDCHVATAAIFGAPNLTRNSKPITIRDFLSGDRLNDCLPVVRVLYPEVSEALAQLGEFSSDTRLTGTGACVFASFGDDATARRASEKLSARGLRVFVTKGRNQSPLHQALGLE